MHKIGIILSSTRDTRFADVPARWVLDELEWWTDALAEARGRDRVPGEAEVVAAA